MSHVNGDDIDDIFRRASEKYPLRTDKADWDKLAADLERDPSLILPALNANEDGRRKKRFLWLFLLLPLGGMGYYALKGSGHPSYSISINQNQANTPSGGSTTSSGGETTKGDGSTHADADGSTHAPATTAKADGSTHADVTAVNPGGSTPSGATKARSDGPGALLITTGRSNQRPNTRFGSAKFSAQVPNGLQVADGTPISAGDGSFTSYSGSSSSSTPDARSYHPFGLQRARTSNGIDLKVNVQSRHTAAATPAPIKLAQPARKPSFYVGLLAAPDLSTIKMQSVTSVGTTFGLLLGYNINRHWAIESGLYLDRKKYYTEGEYFSKKNINVGSNVNISNVDGSCNMWEIPVNIRYNFGQGEKMKWFATAGLSTYLMTSEHYSYVLQYANGGQSWPYSKQYNTNSNYLFSVFNLSIGYEQKIGKIGNLRLEPYLRVPLSGMGTGSLPIMSAGLNIGITRRIF